MFSRPKVLPQMSAEDAEAIESQELERAVDKKGGLLIEHIETAVSRGLVS
jgi:hypothetical protein